MSIEDVVKRVTKKLEKDRRWGDNFDMFERKDILSKKLIGYMADENFFAAEVVLKFMNNNSSPEYDFDRKQFNNYKKAKEKGVNDSDIHKCDILGIIRIYYAEQGVKALLEYYHQRNRVKDYNEKNILKDLKIAVSQV